ncbi:MAG TPA: response regulator transcription factor [Pseudolabrys sp.]|jgi:FixJ family two-component response regulator|nr:response regulator transcription factor [Pseudolabrys sp.]
MSEDRPLVYVIDDEASIREALDSLIRSIRLDVRTFGTTEEFLNFTRPDTPACIILDVRLPGLNGLDFHRELMKRNIELPVIFITGHGDVPMSVRAIKAGAIEFLTKPFRNQDLIDAIYVGIEQDRSRRRMVVISSELQARFALLTTRERQIMLEVVTGRPNKQIAAKLKLSEFTVKIHRGNVMQKMRAKSLIELVRMADTLQDGRQPLSII